MPQNSVASPLTNAPPASESFYSRVAAFSWILSMVFHALLVLVLAFGLSASPRGAAPEHLLEGGIVLKPHDPQSNDYVGEEQFDGEQGSAPSKIGAAQALDDLPPVDPSASLPKLSQTLGPGPTSGKDALSAVGMEKGSKQVGGIGGTPARTKVFGIEGEGTRFVYVFDRSGSMGGTAGSPLKSAKRELLKSLESLGPTHQFQIIFYNEYPLLYEPDGIKGRLVFGTDQGKKAAGEFVAGISAAGGTQHEDALIMALKLQPDVIFFLTDADQPELSAAQLSNIQRRNSGRTSINTIEFGLSPNPKDDNFLKRLAQQNNGQYRYFDVSLLRGAP